MRQKVDRLQQLQTLTLQQEREIEELRRSRDGAIAKIGEMEEKQAALQVA